MMGMIVSGIMVVVNGCGIMNETRKLNDERCQLLMDKLLSSLDLLFESPDENVPLQDGWYVWRNNSSWDIDSYEMVEVVDNRMSVPAYDSYGVVIGTDEVKPYGEIAGPIIGR